MQENVCWFYERDAQFLLIDGVVEKERARVERFRVTTGATLRRERWFRWLRRAFTLPVQAILRNRSLIRTMVRRDVLGRYRGSFGGAFWAVLNPLILMLTYYFVFGVVLRTRFPNDPSRSGFALYFLAGMLPWLAVSEAAGRAPTCTSPVRIAPIEIAVYADVARSSRSTNRSGRSAFTSGATAHGSAASHRQ